MEDALLDRWGWREGKTSGEWLGNNSSKSDRACICPLCALSRHLLLWRSEAEGGQLCLRRHVTYIICDMCTYISTGACVRVFVCATGGWSFTASEAPNPSLSMSSSRAHRNSAVQSCSHSCYSRGWWPPASPNAERERGPLSRVGGPSSATSPYRVTFTFWVLLNVPRNFQRAPSHTSGAISSQAGQNPLLRCRGNHRLLWLVLMLYSLRLFTSLDTYVTLNNFSTWLCWRYLKWSWVCVCLSRLTWLAHICQIKLDRIATVGSFRLSRTVIHCEICSSGCVGLNQCEDGEFVVKGASCRRQGVTMGNFHTDMEVRTPTVGNIIILEPDPITGNILLPDINTKSAFVALKNQFCAYIMLEKHQRVSSPAWNTSTSPASHMGLVDDATTATRPLSHDKDKTEMDEWVVHSLGERVYMVDDRDEEEREIRMEKVLTPPPLARHSDSLDNLSRVPVPHTFLPPPLSPHPFPVLVPPLPFTSRNDTCSEAHSWRKRAAPHNLKY